MKTNSENPPRGERASLLRHLISVEHSQRKMALKEMQTLKENPRDDRRRKRRRREGVKDF